MDQKKIEEEFFISIEHGNQVNFEKIINLYPQSVNFNYPSEVSEGVSAVLYCAYCGRDDWGRILLAKGARVNIHESAAYGLNEKIEEILRDDPHSVNAFSSDGFQPLGLACFFGHLQAVRILIKHGAEINTASRNRMNVMPLHSALASMNGEISRLLLENGARVDAQQTDGFTPLMAAAQVGRIELIELLLDYHADRKIRNDSGQSAGDIARINNWLQAASILDKE